MPNTGEEIGEQQVLQTLLTGQLATLVEDRITTNTIYTAKGVGQWNGLRRLELPNWQASYVQDLPLLTHLKVKSLKYRNSLSQRSLYSLMHLALTTQSYPYTGQSGPLNQTLIAEGIGAVYVQPQYVSAFRNDSEWGNYRIESIEDYPASIDTIDDTWEEIIEACEDGTYATKYQVGDTKEIEINSVPVLMMLVAKDADILDSDGYSLVPTTWMTLPLPTRFTYGVNSGSTAEAKTANWENSYLRGRLESYVMGKIGNASVRNAIKTVRKTYCYRTGYGSAMTTGSCGDRLWIPSVRELLPSDHQSADAYESSGPRYSIVNPLKNFSMPYRYYYDGSSNTNYYAWTRSMTYNNNTDYATYATYYINNNDSVALGTSSSNYSTPLVFGFCI